MNLRPVFTKPEQINMTLSPKKCHVAFPSVKLLGPVVPGLLMPVDHNKVATIKCLSPPTTIAEVQRFLGMCGYKGYGTEKLC